MKTKRTAWIVYTVFTIIYLALNFVIPSDAKTRTKYQINAHSVQLLSLTFAIPLVFIWALAFYDFVQYKTYALSIKKSKEGIAHLQIANGLAVLAISLPISSIIPNLLKEIEEV
jgi:heme/copper-type cytochrome/quinol oxidase subunit 2